jgi:serine phosphatase RsbU (regulator of sigma subunit)
MRRAFYIIILLLSAAAGVFAQAGRQGIPLIKNYLPEQFRGTEQNWAIIQDDRGVMYFGNNDHGVMEYDGETWRHIRVPNNSIVRSLAYFQDVIYVGTVDDFGYLAPDKSGQLLYKSLFVQLDSVDRKFGDVWKIYTRGNEIYFSTDLDKLFVFENFLFKKVYNIPFNPLFTFCVNDHIYAGSFRSGLLELTGDTFLLARNGEYFVRKSILSILPYNDKIIQLGTIPGGVFLYNTETGEVKTTFPSPNANDFLAQNLIYHAILLPDEQVAYATLNRGVLIIDRSGDIRYTIDKQAGLQDEIVSFLYMNPSGQQEPLWLTLSSGISKVEIGSPISLYGENFGIQGSVLDIKRYKGILYLGTLSGLYYITFDESNVPSFHPIREVENSCWAMLRMKPPAGPDVLIAATQRGVFEIRDTNQVTCIEERLSPTNPQYFQAFELQPSLLYPERIYIGLKTGVVALSNRNGKWKKESSYTVVPRNEVRSIAEEPDRTLWLGTLLNGVIRVSFEGKDTVAQVFGLKNNLPSIKSNYVYRYRNELLFGTQKGLYRFNKNTNTFYRDSLFPESFHNGSKAISVFLPDSTGKVWTVVQTEERNWVERLIPRENGSFDVDSISLTRLPSREIDVIFPEPNGLTWFGISNMLGSYNEHLPAISNRSFEVLMRKVTLNEDQVVYYGHTSDRQWLSGNHGSQPKEQETARFHYHMNSISFEYASPFFIEEDATQYSYFLEGLQRNWSKWSVEAKASFNNLREGKYHFHVKAKNIFGQESMIASYDFEILPPLHRTMVAYVAYLALLIALIIGIVKFYARRLIKEKQRLERIVAQRTHEVVEQKKEIEKQHELVLKQKEKIEIQNIEIKDSIKYASRIQRAILPPGDYISDVIPESFVLNIPKDIVSGDFYWFTEKDDAIIIAVADCTGHGVPGAFMSMLGISFLNEIVNQSNILQPSEILNNLRIHVIGALHQRGEVGESRDGMDIALYSMDVKHKNLNFAGAYNPLIIVRDKQIISLKGDNMPIGISDQVGQSFTNYEYKLAKGDVLYSFSDGYADQFGGQDDKKFNIRNLKNLLLEISELEMTRQREILETRLLEWKGKQEQVDDILILGIRI